MTTFCCCEPLFDFNIKWEALTACGTIALAFLTIYIAVAAIQQLKDIQKISVENIIMKQLEFHYKIVEKIKPKGMSNVRDHDAFKFMYIKLGRLYFRHYDISRDDVESVKSNIGIAFNELYRKYGNLLGHYYRNLYRTFKNIDKTEIKGFNKEHYAKLVRAQLSEYEILLLFYNCIWVEDGDKFKDLAERYELFEGMSYDKLFDRDRQTILYNDSAYGDDY